MNKFKFTLDEYDNKFITALTRHQGERDKKTQQKAQRPALIENMLAQSTSPTNRQR